MVINEKVETGVVSVTTHTTMGNLKLANGNNKLCVWSAEALLDQRSKAEEFKKRCVGCDVDL